MQDSDQSKYLTILSLANGLSFDIVWFNSVNNYLRYPVNRQILTRWRIQETTQLRWNMHSVSVSCTVYNVYVFTDTW